jgi:hypothetical protein
VLGWILLVVVLIAVFGVGTVLEVAIELLLATVLILALLVVGGYLFLRAKTGDRSR